MNELEKKEALQREQQAQSEESLQARQMQLLAGDREAIGRYSQPGAQRYKYDAKKNLARNYRDFALSRALMPEGPAAGVFQKAAEHVAVRAEMLSGRDRSLPQGGTPLPAGEKPLDTVVCLQNLCRCRLLEKRVTPEELVRLTEHLTAGAFLTDKTDDPDAALHEQMHAQGLDALQEIYSRVLDALAAEYGAGLCGLSACDYLRRLPQIEDDFACLDDMQRFFSLYRSGAQDAEAARLRARLTFFGESFAILRERGNALASMQPDQVTEKGAPARAAEKDRLKRLAALRSGAVKQKLFAPRERERPLTDFFAEAENRKERANIELLNCRIEIVEPDVTAIGEETSVEAIQARLITHASIRMKRSIAESPGADANARKRALADVARYEKSPDRLTDQEAAALSQKLNDLKQHFSTVPGLVTVTEENAAELIRRQRENEEKLHRFLTGATDAELLRDYVPALALARLVRAEMLQLENCHLSALVNDVLLHEAGTRPLPPELYAHNKPVADAFVSLRTLDAQYSPLYLQTEKIILSRLRSIGESGCTQAFRLTDDVSPLAERARLQASDRQQGAAPALEQAKKCSVPVDIFDAHDETDFKTNLAAMRGSLAAMKTVASFRQEQPDYYRLGQSREDYLSCEFLCGLLPSFEKTFLLTLRKNMLADRGGETQAALESQWRDAYSVFKNEYKRLNDLMDAGHRQKDGGARQLIEQNITELKKKEAVLRADPTVAVRILGEDRLEAAVQSKALVFVETEDRATMHRDLIMLAPAVASMTGADFDGRTADAFMALSARFSRSYERCLDALGQGASPCGDALLLDNCAPIEKCALMAEVLDNLFANANAKKKYRAALASTPNAELSLRELDLFPERAARIRALHNYATGLALGQAAQNGVTTCEYLEAGAISQLTGKKDLEQVGRIFRQRGLPAVSRLRADGLEHQRRSQLEESEMLVRVRTGVGLELEASARKGEHRSASGWMQRAGALFGKPLQFLSWLLHEKRSDRHGEVRFAEDAALYRQTLAALPWQPATLPLWQRGDAQCAPPVDLDRQFASPLKKRLWALLQTDPAAQTLPAAEEDPLAAEYAQALEAARLYCGVVGIVNTDTTEMEMSFLDRYRRLSEKYREMHEASADAAAQKRLALLGRLDAELGAALGGTLAKTMSAEELSRISAGTTAYVEDSSYLPNMTGSNIRDIPLFLHEPNINDVRQSSIGDCWLVSAVGTLTKTDPDFIRSMFHDLGDGNVLVRLYAADSEETDVTRPGVRLHPAYFKLRKQYETGWGNAADCTWVQLLEKAYALSGFNGRNAVEVRGDRLYNVADELTMGNISSAVAHLTGRCPEPMPKSGSPQEISFLSEPVLRGLLAGVDGDTANYLRILLSSLSVGISTQTRADQHKNCFAGVLDLIDSTRHALALRLLGSPDTEPPQAVCDAAYDRLRTQICDNFEKMYRGEPLDFGSEDLSAGQAETPAQRLSDLETRRRSCAYFEKPRPDTAVPYSDEAIDFYQRCRGVFDRRGAVSVSIPHCVSLIDAREYNGRLFLLMRDPFNAYNTTYEMKDGQRQETNEGFLEVFTAREQNRHIVPAAPAYLTAAFRGTSWVELDRLFDLTGEAVSVLPEQLAGQKTASV